MDQKYTNDTMFYYDKDLDENLACLTQKIESQNVIKETSLFAAHKVNAIEQ